MNDRKLFQVGGYVLAGGRSSRMGDDKALLQLAGRPLIQHAVSKLSRVCSEVHILSNNSALAQFAALVPDRHPDCGPIGGLEAALTHSSYDWNLFLAVDMPFLPAAYISAWIQRWSDSADNRARIWISSCEGRPQPGFCLLHKEVLPFLSEAIGEQKFKLMRAFEIAGKELAIRRGFPALAGLSVIPATDLSLAAKEGSGSWAVTSAQEAAKYLWFANLNTPDDFRDAENHFDALDI